MEFQFIEKGSKQLYSVYHEPEISTKDKTGVVLCYPFGQEYIRCHKLYLNLANKLAASGFHVLRFDYFGTGDSSGEFTAVTIGECLEDIDMAVNELKAACGVSEIILVGVRIGASLSLLYSQNREVEGLVLWNPVIDGNYYLASIKKEYGKWLEGSFTKDKRNNNDNLSIFGFSYSSMLIKGIKGISLSGYYFDSGIPVMLIDDENKFKTKDKANMTFEYAVNREFWLKRKEENEKSFVPVHEINKIVDWAKS
jgi:uncharacterized protein